CISSSCGMVSKDLLRSASTTSVWPCRSRTITAWIASVALRFGRVIRVAQDVRSPDLVVEQIEPEVRLPLRLAIEFPLQSPDRIWRLQAHRQSPHLVCFENAPEVRDLPSTRVTRLPRYDDPVRLPRGPAPCSAVEAATPVQHGSPPLPRRLPHPSAGSASTTSLSRPAQDLLALRPVDLLDRPRRPLSQGFDPAGCPTKSPASYRANRPLPGRDFHPLGERARSGTHRRTTKAHEVRADESAGRGHSIWRLLR